MDQRLERTADLGRALVREMRAEKVTFLAGSIAYHAFVSLLPLLVLALTVASAVGEASLGDAVLQLTQGVLTRDASDLLLEEVRAAASGAGVSAVSLAVLVWGTLRIFRGLDTAFSDIYESESENTLLDQAGDAVLVFGTFTAAVFVAGAANQFVPTGGGVGARVVQYVVAVLGLAVAFYPMFYVFPDADVTPLEVLPGVATTAVCLSALQSLFGIYVAFSSQSATESAVAGLLVLLTFLYLAGLTILVGVTVNAVASNRSADVDVHPVVGDHSRSEPTNRDDLRAALDGFDALAEGTDATLTVDGDTFAVPQPATVTVEDDADETVGVEIRWRQSAATAPDEES